MSTSFYNDYSWRRPDEISGRYAPTVHIAWHGADGKRDSNSFTLAERCSTINDANAIALEKAKASPDRWLTPYEAAANWTVALNAISGRISNRSERTWD